MTRNLRRSEHSANRLRLTGGMIIYTVEFDGMRTHSEANARSRFATMRRDKALRSHARLVLVGSPTALAARNVIVLTRRGKRLMDSDNLTRSLKAVRDEIAAWLGIDDGSAQVQWVYEQEKTDAYSVRADIYVGARAVTKIEPCEEE